MSFFEYKYKIKMNWLRGNQEIEIDPLNIMNVVIDRKYNQRNHAVIYVILSVPKPLYNGLIMHKDDSMITLETTKYPVERVASDEDWEESIVEETCMKLDKYKYIITHDIAPETDLQHTVDESDEEKDETPRDLYHSFTLALIKKENIDNNKILLNKVYKNATPMDIILQNTSKFPLVIEPFTYNRTFRELLIPPITSVCTLIKYINNLSPLYDTPYRFFMDFDKAYLLSSKGTPIKLRNETIENIIIYISDYARVTNRPGGASGRSRNTLELEVNRQDTKIHTDQLEEMVYNSAYIADFLGETSNISYNDDSNKKYEFLRCEIPSSKSSILQNYKNERNMSDFMITLFKKDIDVSAITPNKNISINNYGDHDKYDGRFTLIEKKEIYVREGEGFRCATNMTFLKL